MNHETLVYRPHDPRSNANGMLPRRLADPLNISDAAPMVMGDIQPYRAIAADVNGKRPMIGGRRQHREFLARNGYNEVGNEMPTRRPQEMSRADLISDIKRSMGE